MILKFCMNLIFLHRPKILQNMTRTFKGEVEGSDRSDQGGDGRRQGVPQKVSLNQIVRRYVWSLNKLIVYVSYNNQTVWNEVLTAPYSQEGSAGHHKGCLEVNVRILITSDRAGMLTPCPCPSWRSWSPSCPPRRSSWRPSHFCHSNSFSGGRRVQQQKL